MSKHQEELPEDCLFRELLVLDNEDAAQSVIARILDVKRVSRIDAETLFDVVQSIATLALVGSDEEELEGPFDSEKTYYVGHDYEDTHALEEDLTEAFAMRDEVSEEQVSEANELIDEVRGLIFEYRLKCRMIQLDLNSSRKLEECLSDIQKDAELAEDTEAVGLIAELFERAKTFLDVHHEERGDRYSISSDFMATGHVTDLMEAGVLTMEKLDKLIAIKQMWGTDHDLKPLHAEEIACVSDLVRMMNDQRTFEYEIAMVADRIVGLYDARKIPAVASLLEGGEHSEIAPIFDGTDLGVVLTDLIPQIASEILSDHIQVEAVERSMAEMPGYEPKRRANVSFTGVLSLLSKAIQGVCFSNLEESVSLRAPRQVKLLLGCVAVEFLKLVHKRMGLTVRNGIDDEMEEEASRTEFKTMMGSAGRAPLRELFVDVFAE